MKKIFLLLLLPLEVYSQSGSDVLKNAESSIAICKTEFRKKDGTFFTTFTCGLILSGKYFATAFHDSYFPECTIKSRYVVYNYHNDIITTKRVYDSVFIDTNFVANKGQYDFSNHRYDSNDHCTDILILKLDKDIPKYKFRFSTSGTNQNDTIYACGLEFDHKTNKAELKYSISNIAFNHIEKPNYDCYFITSIGNAKEGFSGTPIYNSKGEILGMELFGWNKLPKEYIDYLYKTRVINEDSYNKIILGYSNGLCLNAAVSINYLLEKYFKGYLD